MLRDRHEFQVGVVHLLKVGYQPIGQFTPVQETAIIVMLPGTGMQLVDRDGLVLPVETAAGLEPFAVLPVETASGRSVRDRLGSQAHLPGIGIRLDGHLPFPAENFELVCIAGIKPRNEELPDS